MVCLASPWHEAGQAIDEESTVSARRTLWYSDEFHLFKDGFDDENIYLEVRDARFRELILRIPLIAWKEMRKHTIEPEERYLDLSDSEMREEAEHRVDEHRAALASEPDSRFKGLFGSFLFGPSESSREEMIEHFLSCYGRSLSGSADSNAS